MVTKNVQPLTVFFDEGGLLQHQVFEAAAVQPEGVVVFESREDQALPPLVRIIPWHRVEEVHVGRQP